MPCRYCFTWNNRKRCKMVQGVFGLPGSGKSTYLAKLAKKAFKKYDRVYSNFYIDGCYKLDFDSLGLVDYSDCLIFRQSI